MAEIKKPEQKKTQSFFFVAAAVLFCLMMFQAFFAVKTARVAFSYQLEHVVDLDLLQPEDSRKAATLSNLVTFSGRFRDAKTETGKQRFRYLELIEEQNSLHMEILRLDQEMDAVRRKVVNATALFLGVSGIKIPPL